MPDRTQWHLFIPKQFRKVFQMPKPIIDKAEVSIDLPNRLYHGSFSRSSDYDVKVDDVGVHIALDHRGEQPRHVAFHLHHYLFSGILESVANEITEKNTLSDADSGRLREAVMKLAQALD
jgi:hypothetical protein